jgi:head-tail adaptor
MAYTANDLNKLVEIWKYDVSTNLAGTPIESLGLYKKTYASMRSASGNIQDADPPGEIPRTQVTIVIRYDPVVNYRCEVRYNGQKYKITYMEGSKMDGFLKLICVTYNEFI